MHTSYQPLKPATNKLLKKKWDGAAQDMHRKKVLGAKSVVDTKSPATYTHLQYKMKKMQLEEERHAVIDRDNRHLLEKMSAIMRTRGRVDNWNDYQPKSLNKSKRTRELIRVTLENQKILARIQAKQPQYSAKKWEEEWMETKKFMKSVRKYSDEWYQLQEAERRSKRASKATSRAGSRKLETRDESRALSARETDEEDESGDEKSKPATPTKTATPEKPKTPAKVEKPATPAKAEKPATPAKAEKPATPAQAEKPATPAKEGKTPEKPSTPAKVEVKE